MNILSAPQSFKGTLSAIEVAEMITAAVHTLNPNLQCLELPIADGGDGSLQVLLRTQKKYWLRTGEGINPFLEHRNINWAENTEEKKAFLESASIIGLAQLNEEQKNLSSGTSYGVGKWIKDRIEEGLTRLSIGLGGSATNDGGAGALQALSYQLLDFQGKPLGPGPIELLHLKEIKPPVMIEKEDIEITILCDVQNPLIGNEGATRIYGEQKASKNDDLKKIEEGLEIFAEIVARDLGKKIDTFPMGGAAGGLAAGLSILPGSKCIAGAQYFLEELEFRKYLKNSDLLIVGEGQIDKQSNYGKGTVAAAQLAQELGVPCIAVVGQKKGENNPCFQEVLAVRDLFSFQESMKKPKHCLLDLLLKKLAPFISVIK